LTVGLPFNNGVAVVTKYRPFDHFAQKNFWDCNNLLIVPTKLERMPNWQKAGTLLRTSTQALEHGNLDCIDDKSSQFVQSRRLFKRDLESTELCCPCNENWGILTPTGYKFAIALVCEICPKFLQTIFFGWGHLRVSSKPVSVWCILLHSYSRRRKLKRK